MKRIAFFGICLFLIWTDARAETKYVGDLTEITFRTGPGIDHKIITMLKSGLTVEVIQEEEDWTKVRLPSEREGWVLNRFITSSPPSSLLLKGLKEKNKVLMLQNVSLLEENMKIQAQSDKLAAEFAIHKQTCSELQKAYEILKKESGEYFRLKSRHGKTAQQLAEQTKQIEKLDEEITNIQFSHNIKWFLSGAGVLVLGFWIGFSAKRQRRRSTLL